MNVDSFVSFHIGRYLSPPELGRFEPTELIFPGVETPFLPTSTMPEIAVAEYGDFQSNKCEVRGASYALNMLSVSQPPIPHSLRKRALRP